MEKMDFKEIGSQMHKIYQELSKREKILIGIILALFLFMSLKDNLFEKKRHDFDKEISLTKEEIRGLREELLVEKARNIDMGKQFEPFKELAKAEHPDLELPAGLARLIDDFGLSKKIVLQYEYIPLTEQNKSLIISSLKNLSQEFSKQRMHIEVTCELWVSSEIKALAEEIVTMLSSAGLNASGPSLMTVYKPQMPIYPLAWSYNRDEKILFEQLYPALQPLINPSTKYIENENLPPGKIRMHFAGQVRFDPSGVATIY